MLIYFLICVPFHPLAVLRLKELRSPSGHAIVMASGGGAVSLLLGAHWLGEDSGQTDAEPVGRTFELEKGGTWSIDPYLGGRLPLPPYPTISSPHLLGQSHLHPSTQQGLSLQAALVPVVEGPELMG